jgi:hypothetical protein
MNSSETETWDWNTVRDMSPVSERVDNRAVSVCQHCRCLQIAWLGCEKSIDKLSGHKSLSCYCDKTLPTCCWTPTGHLMYIQPTSISCTRATHSRFWAFQSDCDRDFWTLPTTMVRLLMALNNCKVACLRSIFPESLIIFTEKNWRSLPIFWSNWLQSVTTLFSAHESRTFQQHRIRPRELVDHQQVFHKHLTRKLAQNAWREINILPSFYSLGLKINASSLSNRPQGYKDNSDHGQWVVTKP